MTAGGAITTSAASPAPTRCAIAGAVANLILTSVPVSLRNASAAATTPGSTAPALMMLISAAKAGPETTRPNTTSESTCLFIAVPPCGEWLLPAPVRRDNTPGKRTVNCSRARRRVPAPRSPLRLLGIFQIRRRLVLASGHQEPVGAEHVVFIGDGDVIVGFAAILLAPRGIGVQAAPVVLHHSPRTRQGVVDHRNLVMGDVKIVLV